MKAILLAAGSGKRLGDLTKNLPKALVDINGKSLLERQIIALRKNSINIMEEMDDESKHNGKNLEILKHRIFICLQLKHVLQPIRCFCKLNIVSNN